MYGETKKLHLIEEILKMENDNILDEVAAILNKGKFQVAGSRRSFSDFAGLMSDAEADEFEKIIEEGCEQIHSSYDVAT